MDKSKKRAGGRRLAGRCALAALCLVMAARAYCVGTTCPSDVPDSVAVRAVPLPPDYDDATMWYVQEDDRDGMGADVFYVVSTWEFDWTTADGRTCHYADVWNPEHRARMNIEQQLVARYMGRGNNFYAPYYRHITLGTWATLNEDTIGRRIALSMDDVRRAFEHFQHCRDRRRPFVLAGFSQGAKAVVELVKHMDDDAYRHLVAAYVMGYKVTPADTLQCARFKAATDSADVGVTICYNSVKDVRYIKPIVSSPCAMCINPVNWRTDDTPALLHDSITVVVDTARHVLVLKGYDGREYPPILNFLNSGDVHGCEPWLYSESLGRNVALRIREWRKRHR